MVEESRIYARRAFRRTAIIETASVTFLKHGYAGTAMSEIAKNLGGSKGTLWKYFPSKKLLFQAAIESASEVFRRKAAEIFVEERSADGALRKFCREYIRLITSDDGL